MPNVDLISRDAMIKKIKQIRAKAKTLTGVDMVMLLEAAPTVDAAPVVRCKDCKHRPTDNTNIRSCGGFDIEFPDEICPCQCDDGYYNWYPDSDWFCSNGEAKDGGEDE